MDHLRFLSLDGREQLVLGLPGGVGKALWLFILNGFVSFILLFD